MEALISTILVIAVSGSFGGIILGLAKRTSHKIRMPIIGKLIEIGFLGDILVGAGASVALFFVAAPLLDITFADGQTQTQWIKIVSLGVISGLAGMKILTSTASHIVWRLAVLDDRMERVERAETVNEFVRRADGLVADNRLEHALATYDEALAINPRNEQALIGKAGVYAERSQWDKAISTVSRILQIDPSSKRAYYHRARYKNMAGKYPKEEILQDLKSAVLLDAHYKNYAALHDTHFENLRADEEFRRIVE